MPISNYTELKTAIQDYAKRTDALSMLDTFIDLAEVDIWDKLETKSMEARTQSVTGTTDRFMDLPAGFIEMRRVRIILDDGYQVPVKYVDPANLRVWGTTGMPRYFTVGGGDTDELEFDRVPDQAYTVEMMYFKSLAALSATDPTNDLLTNHPMVYLAGSLRHFYLWAQNVEEAAIWDGLFTESIGNANAKARRQRYGPNPAMTNPGMIV